jgi:thiamine pyrophosphate-dependent acetolactate synthase large subunit-like protein
MPEEHPLSVRWLGMHGAVYANNTVNEADVVIAIGARFDDRVTGAVRTFCEHSRIIHIDYDAAELNKNKKVDFAIRADAGAALAYLNSKLESMGMAPREYAVSNRPEWFGIIEAWKKQYPLTYVKNEREIAPQQAIEELYNQLKDEDAIICTGVGFTIQPFGQKYITAERAGVLAVFNPLTAAVLGVVFLHERLTGSMILGAILILISILAPAWIEDRRSRKQFQSKR